MSESASRKDRILAAASSLIAQKGLQALRMSEVATTADVTPHLLAYHFPSKQALLTAALEYAARRAPSTNLLHRTPGVAARETLRTALLAEFDERSSVRELNLVWNEVAALPNAQDALHAQLRAVTEDWNDQVMIGVLRCIAEGSMRSDLAPESLAAMLTAMVEGLSQRWLAGVLDVAEAREALDHLLTAFQAPAPA
ncbi:MULTISPECIES: TetR/AcrR family transcriptional regulator [Microbacterium]|uniref:TetR/AcrR family transcriptional regulator n=1 Tax=Microbacterium TaxID=33882 RepID=UPI003010506B